MGDNALSLVGGSVCQRYTPPVARTLMGDVTARAVGFTPIRDTHPSSWGMDLPFSL
jgi:hypothetical protein